MNILDEIFQYKLHQFPKSPPSMSKALLEKGGVNIIGEIKRGSPSKGQFAMDLDVERAVERYHDADITGFSVLTDDKYFFGGFEDLAQVVSLTEKPVLCKDFIVSEQQIAKASSHGASVILLIARMLDNETLERFITFAHSLSLEVLMEIHYASEFERIRHMAFDILGINNRDLDTFKTDISHSIVLYRELELDKVAYPVISESGMLSYDDIKKVIQVGFDGVLVGEGMVKSLIDIPKSEHDLHRKNPMAVRSGNEVIKICGLKETSHIDAAYIAGATHIGFVMAESKRRVDLDTCKRLIDYAKQNAKGLKTVVVLKDVSASEIITIDSNVHADFYQVHGKFEKDVQLNKTLKIIRAFSIEYILNHEIEFNEYDGMPILIDAPEPGSGKVFDWTYIPKVLENAKGEIWFAGGLDQGNVKELIQTYHVKGVDVSSGVEIDGKKNTKAIQLFIKSAKEGFLNA